MRRIFTSRGDYSVTYSEALTEAQTKFEDVAQTAAERQDIVSARMDKWVSEEAQLDEDGLMIVDSFRF